MLKMLKAALVLVTALWAVPSFSAGTIPLALSVQTDLAGNIASGCQLSFFVAGTVATPQNAFSDFGLTTPTANPISCDQGGRLPMFWLADGLIHIRLTDSSGIPIVDTTMQVLGPASGGGGGGGTVDPTSILSTGDWKLSYGTGTLSGFVRANGLTIGNATSGATERANADTQALFIKYYGADPNLVVSGGRTGNALNDYNANKQLTLPDSRGRGVAGLDDMGNSAAGRLTATYFGNSGGCSAALATVLGVACGGESQTLALGQLPTGITAAGTFGLSASGFMTNLNNELTGFSTNAGGVNQWLAWTTTTTHLLVTNPTASGTVTSNNTGGAAHPIVQPTILMTLYIKL